MTDSILIAGQIVVGFVVLVAGGELLVRGAAALAGFLRVSPLVIGLTVVAFGTSAPELGVSLQAALDDSADVAIGNVVGSNITNILLILGVSSLVTPLLVSSQLIRTDVPLMICASIGFWLVSADGMLVRWEGLAMFGLLVLYIVYCIRKSRSEHAAVVDDFDQQYTRQVSGFRGVMLQLIYIVAGLALLAVGSELLVDGAEQVAKSLGVSELVIGLTIVAIGTSLPEAVTSVVASIRGQRDIAVGNVVGSNLFNILCVLGLTAAVAPSPIPVSQVAIDFDIPVMVAVAVICLPIFLTGSVIRRWEGALFLSYYIAYTTFIVLAATRADIGRDLNQPLLYGVLPLTLLALLLAFLQTNHKRARNR